MRRLNIKLLIWLIGGLIVTVAGVHVLHGIQISRNADVLKREADKAEQEGDLREAFKKYSQYLKHRRDDVPTLAKMAILSADIAEKPDANKKDFWEAFKALEAASKHHELTEVRRRNIDFLMKIGRFIDAMDHLQDLRAMAKQEGKRDPDLDIKFAVCEVRTGHDDSAVQTLNELVGYDESDQSFSAEKAAAPQSIEAYLLLADLMRRRFDDAKRADLIMDQLIVANPEVAKAQLEYGRYKQRQGQTEPATEALDKALKLEPKNPDVVLAAAEVAIARKEFEKGQQLLDEGVAENPKSEGMYRGLATLALAQGKFDAALDYVHQGLEQVSKSQVLLLLLADLQLQKGDLDGLRDSIAKMRSADFRQELVAYFEARLAFAEQKWLSASKQFKNLRPMMAAWPDLMVQVDLFTGQCYERLGQPDLQLEAFQRVLDVDSGNVAARVGHTRALFAIGRQKEAEQELASVDKALRGRAIVSPQVRSNMLQVRISDQLQKPAAERNWDEVDAIAAEILEGDQLDDLRKGVFRAEILLAKDEVKQAQSVLNGLRKEHPKDVSVWLALVKLVQRQNALEVEKRGKLKEPEAKELAKANGEKLLKLLDTAKKNAGDQLPFRAARASILARLGGDNAAENLAKLEEGSDKFTKAEQLALWAELGNAYYQLRDYKNVRRFWQKIAADHADDPKIKQTLFDLAQEFGDETDMDAELAEIGKLAGNNSPMYKYCAAEKIVWEVRTGKKEKPALVDARKLVDDAQLARRDWHELFRLEGDIDDLEEKPDAAIASYQRALELGPANPATARRLVVLLYSRGRNQEVQQAMQFVGRSGSSDLIDKINAETKFRTGGAEAALAMAEKAVSDDPDNATNHLWYGQMLARAGKNDQAEEQFRAAVEKAGDNVQAWLMLINHLAAAKKSTEAAAAIEQAKKVIPAEQQNLVLAQAYAQLGDREQADKYFEAALQEHPDDLGVLRAVAMFNLRTARSDKAREYVAKVLAAKIDPDDKLANNNLIWARRTMAEILARRGDFGDVQKAIKLIEENSADGKPAADDTLQIAGILAARPEGQSRQRAVKLLEQLQSQRPLGPQEQLTLAALYERAGDWTKARDLMASLAGRFADDPTVLANFVQMLIRHHEQEDVGAWMEKLERSRPNAPITMQLKARWLAEQGKPSEATDYLLGLIPDNMKPEQLPLLGAIAGLLEDLKQNEPAEKLYRDFYERNPRAILLLANFLGRHGNLDESFALYDQARKSEPLAAVFQGALQTARARPDEMSAARYATITKWLKAAMDDEPDSTDWQIQLAQLYELEGKLDAAVDIYRQIMATPDIDDRKRAIMKNNLAFILAVRGSAKDVAEAEKTIGEALEVLGPIADVLDTRGMVMLIKGDTKQAIADLQTAVADAPVGAKYFHLALAEEKAGDKAATEDAFRRAVELKLDPQTLPADEQKAFARMQAQFGEPK